MSDGLTAEIVAGLRSPNDGKYVCGIAADLIESQARRISELEITLFDARQALIREGMEVNRLRDSQPPVVTLPKDSRQLLVTVARDAGFSRPQWDAMFFESGPYSITEATHAMERFAELLLERLTPAVETTPQPEVATQKFQAALTEYAERREQWERHHGEWESSRLKEQALVVLATARAAHETGGSHGASK